VEIDLRKAEESLMTVIIRMIGNQTFEDSSASVRLLVRKDIGVEIPLSN
jgi:hypothetical protein